MAGAALVAFVFAATLGLYMAYAHFRGERSTRATGALHGFFVLAGFIFLVAGLLRVPDDVQVGWGWWLFAGFGAVALGGLFLLSRQSQGKKWPNAALIAHGLGAIAMLVILGIWLGDLTGFGFRSY